MNAPLDLLALRIDAALAALRAGRPVVLNGIAVVATRPDLIDRVIHVDMPTIPPEARKDDADTSAAWERDRPLVFGALLDLFADALRILPSVKLAHKQRMADFERFGEAVARASRSTVRGVLSQPISRSPTATSSTDFVWPSCIRIGVPFA